MTRVVHTEHMVGNHVAFLHSKFVALLPGRGQEVHVVFKLAWFYLDIGKIPDRSWRVARTLGKRWGTQQERVRRDQGHQNLYSFHVVYSFTKWTLVIALARGCAIR